MTAMLAVRSVVRGVLFLASLVGVAVLAGFLPPTPVYLAIAIAACLVLAGLAASVWYRNLEPIHVPTPHVVPDLRREERGTFPQ